MDSFYLALGALGMGLQVVVIYAMTRGPGREFPGVFFYLLVLFLTGIADTAVFLDVANWPPWYREYYYLNNTVRHLAGFVALVSLAYIAGKRSQERSALHFKLFLGSVVIVAGSFLLASGGWPDYYMNQAGRNLSFATMVLNVVLWTSLIKFRTQDHRLFLVSGGLGLNMAGEAIGQSLVQLGEATSTFGNLISVFSHLLCLCIWWQAFRRAPAPVMLPKGRPSR